MKKIRPRSQRIHKLENAEANPLKENTGAVALILVIWVMIILVAIVTEFSYSMRTEINITRNFKEEEESYQLALAGIEYARAEIMSIVEAQNTFVNEEGVLVFDPENTEPVRTRSLGKGGFEYTITDEDGKLNINTATREQLKYLFLESGVYLENVDEIVDSIIDWRDKNDLHMLNGAEEDYYRDLDEPYSCKDGPFDSIEELLLVKGMTPEILYGSPDEDEEEEDVYDGVVEYLTVRGTSKININTAPRLVLEAVMGIDAANNIMLQREAGTLSRVSGKEKIVSEYYTIISKGTNADGTIKRSVKAVVHNTEDKMEILYWNDNFIR
jgi:general secretion pathway protein K